LYNTYTCTIVGLKDINGRIVKYEPFMLDNIGKTEEISTRTAPETDLAEKYRKLEQENEVLKRYKDNYDQLQEKYETLRKENEKLRKMVGSSASDKELERALQDVLQKNEELQKSLNFAVRTLTYYTGK
jgi:cell shape-determining protein MreC